MKAVDRDAVLAATLAAGADAAAVAPAGPLHGARAALVAAFDSGAYMTWPYDGPYARRATDARTLLAGARSVVCIAVAYDDDTGPRRPRPGRGRVSNYAWSRDYHRTMRDRLTAAARAIDGLAGDAVCAIACDTAPLNERAFAAAAGLGWIGKHGSLIVPRIGSFVFLGEIATTLELEPTPSSRRSCGSCTRCVRACPTGALHGDGRVDVVRCISDLTQRRDAIPPALRPLVGQWVWGCDLCQDVCPPTRRGRHAAAAFAALDADLAEPPLTDLLRTRGAAFRRRYGATAMGWRGAAVLRRNAAVALGNGLDRGHVADLDAALRGDPSALVRGHAAWALGRIGSPRARAALAAAEQTERDAAVQAEIAAALEPRAPTQAL